MALVQITKKFLKVGAIVIYHLITSKAAVQVFWIKDTKNEGLER